MCKGGLRLEIDIINKVIKLSEHCVRDQDESSDSEETLKNFHRFLKSSHILLGANCGHIKELLPSSWYATGNNYHNVVIIM